MLLARQSSVLESSAPGQVLAPLLSLLAPLSLVLVRELTLKNSSFRLAPPGPRHPQPYQLPRGLCQQYPMLRALAISLRRPRILHVATGSLRVCHRCGHKA